MLKHQTHLLFIGLFSCAAMLLGTGATFAATTFQGGDIATGGNWSNGLPTDGNNGTIGVDGSIPTSSSTFTANAPFTVTHSDGTLTTVTNSQISSSGGGALAWNQTGGDLAVPSLFLLGNNTAFTLSGGTITGATTAASQRISLIGSNNNTFIQTGGETIRMSLDINQLEREASFLGGTATDFGRGNVGFAFWFRVGASSLTEGSIMRIGGDFTLSFYDGVSAAAVIRADSNAASDASNNRFIFEEDWTGSFTRNGFTEANWITAFTEDGITYVGDDLITAGNFLDYFVLSNTGEIGSSLALIPEPGSVVLLLAGSVLIAGRRVRR